MNVPQGAGGPGGPGAGAPGPAGAGGPGAMGLGGGPGGAGGSVAAPDYSNPMKGAQSFLDAVKQKDGALISEAMALRAATEAEPRRREFFKALKEQSVAPEDLDEMIRNLDGMAIVNVNESKSTGVTGIIIGKMDGADYLTRTVYMRREKDGWKVQDIGAPKRDKSRPRGGAGGRN